MNKILLEPTDVLFFRDGRPMAGSFAGHGAAWPMPSIINAAFHAALHRAYPVHNREEIDGNATRQWKDHVHRSKRSGQTIENQRQCRFGSLTTVGPFPVLKSLSNDDGNAPWFFSRPMDLLENNLLPSLMPCVDEWRNRSSLPKPLKYAMANQIAPNKDIQAKAWLNQAAFSDYLHANQQKRKADLSLEKAVQDRDLFDEEHTVGIAIDPETQTAGQGDAEGKIYSAHYLRLRQAWRLGVLAHCPINQDENLLGQLLDSRCHIIVGGQQRVCTAQKLGSSGILPLPRGKNGGFQRSNSKHLVNFCRKSPG